MKRLAATRLLLGGFAAILLLAGCGGGGGGDTPQSSGQPPAGTASVFSWSAPSTFNDNTPLNPTRDIEYYELYLRTDPNFTDNDLPVVQVAAVAAGSPVTEFTLESIPSLPSAMQLYVSIRAVGVDQQKSAFMAPIFWDRT